MAGGSDTVQTTQNQSSMSQMSYPQYTQDANKALTMGAMAIPNDPLTRTVSPACTAATTLGNRSADVDS